MRVACAVRGLATLHAGCHLPSHAPPGHAVCTLHTHCLWLRVACALHVHVQVVALPRVGAAAAAAAAVRPAGGQAGVKFTPATMASAASGDLSIPEAEPFGHSKSDGALLSASKSHSRSDGALDQLDPSSKDTEIALSPKRRESKLSIESAAAADVRRV